MNLQTRFRFSVNGWKSLVYSHIRQTSENERLEHILVYLVGLLKSSLLCFRTILRRGHTTTSTSSPNTRDITTRNDTLDGRLDVRSFRCKQLWGHSVDGPMKRSLKTARLLWNMTYLPANAPLMPKLPLPAGGGSFASPALVGIVLGCTSSRHVDIASSAACKPLVRYSSHTHATE